jgi:PAS domain S-box-containing protein
MSLKRLDKIAILITYLISGLVLIGWAFGIPELKSILPKYITMKANTAIGLILLASSLACSLSDKKRIQWLSPVFSSLAFTIGFLTLCEYIFGVNIGLDELFFTDVVPPGARFPPGRLAPITAINLMLIAMGQYLIFPKHKRFYQAAQLLTFVAFLISFQALVGYLLGVTYSFGSAFYTQMALHTALLFSLLSVGVLYSQREYGFMALVSGPTFGGQTARRLIAAAMLVPPTVTWLYLQGEKIGLYDADFGVLIRVMGNVFFFFVIVWRTAIALNKAEVAQYKAESELKETNLLLEQKVENRTQDLRQSESRVRAILDSALDAIVGMDSQGFVNEWNPRAESMFGWKKAEVLGKRMSEVIMPEKYRPMHEAGVKHFVESGVSTILNRNIELVALKKDGSVFPIELSISATGSNHDYNFTAFIGDITQRKIAEEKMKQMNLELEDAALEARQASELKSFFLANMSHEIRTPINGVIGMAGLALDTELTTKQREYLEIIRLSADNLLTIINDILDLSKIESGKMELEKIDFEVASLIRDIHRSMIYSTEKKSLQLDLDLSEDVTTNVNGDPGRLRQIFLNLIANAVKFTEQGKVTIRGRKTGENENGMTFRFEVQDSGIGISKDQQVRLFQPFSQADHSTSRKFGGTGLGLSICRRLVSLMKGEIGVTSENGEGSTFWFTVVLPKSKVAVITHLEKNETLVDNRTLGHILVVEDNPVNQKVALGMLQKLGHRVEVVGNGKEALEALARVPYHLILMDCHMPEMDGFEATQQIRAGKVGRAKIPVIAMTANALSGDREKCIAAGMSDYISKPVSIGALDKMIQKWL